jgi:hypothetical protein
MLIEGRLSKIGKQWTAEIPLLQTMVAAKPMEPVEHALDKLEDLAKDHGLRLNILSKEEEKFFVEIQNLEDFFPLVLKRKRIAKKLSIADVAKRLGNSSRNSYAQYEYGKTKLTLQKYAEILHVIDPQLQIVVSTISQ